MIQTTQFMTQNTQFVTQNTRIVIKMTQNTILRYLWRLLRQENMIPGQRKMGELQAKCGVLSRTMTKVQIQDI